MELFFPVAIYLLVITAGISYLTVAISMRLAYALRVLDVPRGGRLHKEPVPLLGGAGIFAALAAVVALHGVLLVYCRGLAPDYFLQFLPSPVSEAWHKLDVVGLGAFLMLLLGMFDDRRQSGAGFRLLAEVLIAGLVVLLGVRPTLAHLPEPVVFALTVCWIVGITNAFNLVDGLDGLAGTLALVACGVFLVFMSLTGQVVVAMLLAALAGAVCGFLAHNWHPARTYMGSGGALLLGYLLATIPLVSDFMQHNNNSIAPVLLPVLVLSVPLYDTASVVFLRLRNGRSPFRSDHNHLAHRLLRLGLSVPQAVTAMGLLGLSTGLMSLLLHDAGAWQALAVLFSVAAMFAVFVILERTHLAQRDAQRLVNFQATCAVGGRGDLAATARLASADGLQLSVSEEFASAFAEILSRDGTVSATLFSPREKSELTLNCSVTSLWKTDKGVAFAGLAPFFPDPAAREQAAKWIARAAYPARDGS